MKFKHLVAGGYIETTGECQSHECLEGSKVNLTIKQKSD